MRGWTELAPYNFIHALRLSGPPDAERWRTAVAEVLGALGLETTSLTIERPAAGIDDHLEAELNRGFTSEELPLRFFLSDDPAGGYWLGIVLDHWFADDFSSRALLERIFSRYHGTDSAELTWAKRQWPRRAWLLEWRSFFQQAKSLRRACRLPLKCSLDFTVGAFRTELPAGALPSVRALAKQVDATVHDVFLAAAAQACGAAPAWALSGARDSIGLASAMDLRRLAKGAAREGFGLLISQYAVVESHPEKVLLPELIARITEKTRALKQFSGRAVFVAGLLMWWLARSRRAKATLYQRGAPFAVGLSNVNLSGSWIETAGIAEFRRVGPNGPVVPLLMMITTLHGRIFVDTTYRTSAFTRLAAESLLADFSRRLTAANLDA